MRLWEDGETLVVKSPKEKRATLIRENPDVFSARTIIAIIRGAREFTGGRPGTAGSNDCRRLALASISQTKSRPTTTKRSQNAARIAIVEAIADEDFTHSRSSVRKQLFRGGKRAVHSFFARGLRIPLVADAGHAEGARADSKME